MTDQGTIWLTQEAYDKLQAELDDLRGPRRQEIIEKIAAARDEGDLKENSGYHAAKEEQGKMEARIRQLTHLLRIAEVGHAPESHGVVVTGTVITAMIAGDESVFLLGNREIASDSEIDVWSESSPLGRAIVGLKIGDKTSFEAPNGKLIAVEVVKVETYTGK